LNEPAGWLDDIWLACRDDYYPNGYGIVREAFPGKMATEKYSICEIYFINNLISEKISVADPGCLPGSEVLPSRILDPGSASQI
jgi:hypothetical protein